ncbi:hypothetical protein [Erythrobacter sp. YT30]|uniref:hypothetical protein n=1 Tax=Erythrobacter sp. YT30 TaxID=1735012 RepID=UPI00076C9B22|nr:hypothetical protein [Erythrobacter sp. YT30]KWV93148.1 hypothetical protein AUC45_03225 [Erythrobacter sp. YT30]
MSQATPKNAAKLPALTGTIPDFTPVPRQRMRRGGWSADRQRAFIEALAETGSVRAACRRLGVGEHHIYKLRRHPEAESFRKAWEAALDCGIQRIEDIAMERAVNGVEVPVYHAGELIGTRRAYNDRLLMFLLKNRAPQRFPEGQAGIPMSKAGWAREKTRLKRKWRKKWEEERAASERAGQRQTSAAEVRASIDRKIESLRREAEIKRQREWDMLSEETRAAWERFETLRDRDLDAMRADEDMRRAVERKPRLLVEKNDPA